MSFSCVGECARQNFESARGSRWQNRALRTIQKLHWSVGGQSRDCGRRFFGFPFPFGFLSFSRFLFFSACVPSPSIDLRQPFLEVHANALGVLNKPCRQHGANARRAQLTARQGVFPSPSLRRSFRRYKSILQNYSLFC